MEVDKVDIARHHGVEDFPTLVFYKSEIPAVYEGTVEQRALDLSYEKLFFILQIEKIAKFFLFKIQKMVFCSLNLNPIVRVF